MCTIWASFNWSLLPHCWMSLIDSLNGNRNDLKEISVIAFAECNENASLRAVPVYWKHDRRSRGIREEQVGIIVFGTNGTDFMSCVTMSPASGRQIHSRIWGACTGHAPRGSRFFRFDIQNFWNVTASGVHAPCEVHAPYGKSWIRHCLL